MEKTAFQVRPLALKELSFDFFNSFVRTQVVQNAWRRQNGKWAIVPAPFIDDWSAGDRRLLVKNLRSCLLEGGAVFGAWHQGHLAAFGAVSAGLIGDQKQYADLLELHTDQRYRRMGLGRAIFERIAAWAAEKGAQKLYISAHSAQESQAFYRGIGCVDAQWICRLHVEQEPYDCQLEYVLPKDI